GLVDRQRARRRTLRRLDRAARKIEGVERHGRRRSGLLSECALRHVERRGRTDAHKTARHRRPPRVVSLVRSSGMIAAPTTGPATDAWSTALAPVNASGTKDDEMSALGIVTWRSLGEGMPGTGAGTVTTRKNGGNGTGRTIGATTTVRMMNMN